MLVHRDGAESGKPHWLLFKLRDVEAGPENDFNIAEQEPLGVKTNRDPEEIAAGKKSGSKNKTKTPPRKAAKTTTPRRSARAVSK
jgi:hypothetical protein